jgi:predicted metal-dependent peptidase
MTIEDVVVYLITHGGTFYASLLSQMKRVVDKKMVDKDPKDGKEYPTLGVTIRNGAIELHYHPDLFDALTPEQARALLEHECLHIVMDHLARRIDKDPQSWNMATDVAINQMIQGLPKNVITLDSFPPSMRENYPASDSGTRNPKKLYPNDSAEDYYKVIYQMTPQQKQDAGGGGDGGQGTDDPNGQGKSKAQQKRDQQKQGHGQGSHELWGQADESMIASEVAKQAVMEAVERSRGEVPANIRQRVDEMTKPAKVSWRRILREFVAASVKAGSKHSWKRTNRRYGEEQKGKLPDRQVKITICIDTSGSISERDYVAFMSEVSNIQSCYKSDITVLECDAQVGKEYKLTRYKKLDQDFSGGGGTSFRPPFKYVRDKNIRTDVFIYFTDMEGDFPTTKPPFPTLWVSTNYRPMTAPFGKVIKLEQEDEKS